MTIKKFVKCHCWLNIITVWLSCVHVCVVYSRALTVSFVYSRALTVSFVYSRALTVSCVYSRALTVSFVYSRALTVSFVYSRALRVEEQCLATNLAGCPASVSSDLMSSLMAFFPAENCHIKMADSNKILIFAPEQQH